MVFTLTQVLIIKVEKVTTNKSLAFKLSISNLNKNDNLLKLLTAELVQRPLSWWKSHRSWKHVR
jgi:hypothetical protein